MREISKLEFYKSKLTLWNPKLITSIQYLITNLYYIDTPSQSMVSLVNCYIIIRHQLENIVYYSALTAFLQVHVHKYSTSLLTHTHTHIFLSSYEVQTYKRIVNVNENRVWLLLLYTTTTVKISTFKWFIVFL